MSIHSIPRGSEAFLGLPLLPRPASTLISSLRPQRTPRRSRYVCTPCARSLDSYREGMRFREPSSENSSRVEKTTPKPKQRVVLVKAMVQMNVASHETCLFMVRKGCVRVNGEVVQSEKTRIDRTSDSININGTDYGSLEQRSYDTDDREDFEKDKGFLPRGQRDFRRDDEDDGRNKKFSRRVDGGFYANKKYHFGK